jgi:hypothetical protein
VACADPLEKCRCFLGTSLEIWKQLGEWLVQEWIFLNCKPGCIFFQYSRYIDWPALLWVLKPTDPFVIECCWRRQGKKKWYSSTRWSHPIMWAPQPPFIPQQRISFFWIFWLVAKILKIHYASSFWAKPSSLRFQSYRSHDYLTATRLLALCRRLYPTLPQTRPASSYPEYIESPQSWTTTFQQLFFY